MGRKERTAFESRSSVNRDFQLEHNLSVFDSLHSIDLSNWQGQFQAFPTYLPTDRPTNLLYFMTYLRYFTTYPGNPRESTFLGQSLGIWQQKKSKSRLLCFGWESFHSRPLYFEGPVWKRLLQKFTLFTLKRVSIKVSLIEDFWDFFFGPSCKYKAIWPCLGNVLSSHYI